MRESASVERERSDPYCIGDEEAVALLTRHSWHRFAVLGDSIAEGIGDPSPGYRDLSWTDRIAEALRSAGSPELAYANFGRLDALAEEVHEKQLEPALAFEPSLALVVCGGNNCLQRVWDPDAVEKELRSMVGALRASEADVITVGMFDITRTELIPQPMRDLLGERFHELARRTGKLAKDLDTIHVDFTNHPGCAELDMYSKDLRHGTRRAHAVCASDVIRHLGARLRGGPA